MIYVIDQNDLRSRELATLIAADLDNGNVGWAYPWTPLTLPFQAFEPMSA